MEEAEEGAVGAEALKGAMDTVSVHMVVAVVLEEETMTETKIETETETSMIGAGGLEAEVQAEVEGDGAEVLAAEETGVRFEKAVLKEEQRLNNGTGKERRQIQVISMRVTMVVLTVMMATRTVEARTMSLSSSLETFSNLGFGACLTVPVKFLLVLANSYLPSFCAGLTR